MNKHVHQNELKPKEKMSLEDLKSLFPEYDPMGRRDVNKATKKGYKHVQGKRKPVHLLGRKTLKIEKEKTNG